MTATLKEIRQEIAKLEKQARDIQEKDKRKAVQDVKDLIQQYEIGAEDLGFELKYKRRAKATRKAAAVRFKKGDQTWSGRGRKPRWINEIIEKDGEQGLEKYRVF